jgi:hypothetical protein
VEHLQPLTEAVVVVVVLLELQAATVVAES